MLAVEMSYLRGACGVTRLDGESNESMYERCAIPLAPSLISTENQDKLVPNGVKV